MTTITMLMLLVAAASTIAFTPPGGSSLPRSRRGATGDGAKSSSTSGSFSSSGSSGGAGGGFGGSGFGNFQGGGAGGYPYYPSQNQVVPFDFQALFRQYFENLQRLSQQNPYAPNYQAASVSTSFGHGHFGWAGSVAAPPAGSMHTVLQPRHQSAAPAYNSRLVANPVTSSHSRARAQYFPNRFFGPGFGENSLDSGNSGYGGSSSGSFSGFGGAGGFGGHQGAPAGFGNQGRFGSQGGFGGQGFDGNQGGYGGSQGGFGGNQGGFGGPQGGYGGNQGGFGGTSGSSSDGPVGAQASVNLDTRGGFGEASFFPADLGSRIGQDIPAPNGGNYGVFTSSSSGSSDIGGKKTSFKSATVGVNDNGKVSTFTVKDPQ